EIDRKLCIICFSDAVVCDDIRLREHYNTRGTDRRISKDCAARVADVISNNAFFNRHTRSIGRSFHLIDAKCEKRWLRRVKQQVFFLRAIIGCWTENIAEWHIDVAVYDNQLVPRLYPLN